MLAFLSISERNCYDTTAFARTYKVGGMPVDVSQQQVWLQAGERFPFALRGSGLQIIIMFVYYRKNVPRWNSAENWWNSSKMTAKIHLENLNLPLV